MKEPIYRIFTLTEKNYTLINGVVIRKLTVHTDPRGTLTEILKTTWENIYNKKRLPFTQVYYSTTKRGLARDKGRWHFHPGGQCDRYAVILGDVVFAIYDVRENSPTKNQLNLFLVGESLGSLGQYELLVPPQTLHGFLVVSQKDVTLLNFPNRLYDPKEEVRLPFADFPLPDGSTFSWKEVRMAYETYVKKT